MWKWDVTNSALASILSFFMAAEDGAQSPVPRRNAGDEMVSKQVLFRGPMITGGEQRRSAGKPYRHNCPGNRRFGLISKECSCNYALSWCRRGVLCIFLEHGEVVWLDESPRACAERLKQITCWIRMHDIARTFWKGDDDVRYWVLFLEITAEKLVGGGTI